MKPKIKIIIVSVIVAFISWIGWRAIRPYFGYNSNRLIVSVESPLKQEELTIETGFFTINRESDKELFEKKNGIIFKGKEISRIENDYGENDFLIKYADSCYFQFRHFKTNNKQRDTYNFRIYLKDKQIFIHALIDGTDPMKFERGFNSINKADSLICNVQKKDAGYVYNMKELQKKKSTSDNENDNIESQSPQSMWIYDCMLDTIKQVRVIEKDSLHYDNLINILNSKYSEKVKLDFVRLSNDTIFVKIKNSEYLTQGMGTTGADEYMIEATFTLTELSEIQFVNYDFEFGDHASPGTYNRKYYLDWIKENKEMNKE